LSFHGELFNSQVFFPIVGQRFVESGVFFLSNFFLFSGPDGFDLILFLIFGGDFFHFFLLFFGFFFLFFLDFDVVVFLLLVVFLLGFFLLVAGNLLLDGFLDLKLNGELDEFGVFFDQIFDSLFFQKFYVVGFHVQNQLGSSGHVGVVAFFYRESSSGGRGPDVALIIVRFRDNFYFIGN
jgi:hypothetical protein